MIPCVIFGIGAELLEGSVADTNSAFISKKLTAEGMSPQLIALLPDAKDAIAASIEAAMRQYPLVLTTGGLGPTFDDLTAEAVAHACGVRAVMFETVKEHITKRLTRLNVAVNDNHLRQALLPEGSVLFHNEHGTAYGFGVEAHGSIVISMPGVPYEMHAMFTGGVLPYLRDRFTLKAPFRIDLRFGNVAESDVDVVIRRLGIPDGVTCIINVSMGEVVVKIRDDGAHGGGQFAEKIKEELAYCYLGRNDEGPAVAAVKLLKEGGFTLSVAESCTGGLLGAAVTSVAGASDVFVGGVISYDNKVKSGQLGVPEEILRKYGAVSEECARAMAGGIKKLLLTDCAISVTGIAGPSGGTAEKPVGTVYIAVSCGETIECRRFLFSGGRDAVRERAVKSALAMLVKVVRG